MDQHFTSEEMSHLNRGEQEFCYNEQHWSKTVFIGGFVSHHITHTPTHLHIEDIDILQRAGLNPLFQVCALADADFSTHRPFCRLSWEMV